MKSRFFLIYAAFCHTFVSAVEFYVSPTGSDSNTGTSASPFQTLTKAQQAVRNQLTGTINENITVNLGAGTYALSAPLKFTADDSGKNGFAVNWVGSGNSTISGGLKISGWTAGSNGVYSASVPTGTKSRNLYVNGQASNYARKNIANRKDFTFTSTGMTWSSSTYDWIPTTAGIGDAEIRFISSFTDRYAPIKSAKSKELVMDQNVWFNQMWGYDTVAKPNADFGVWVQNALALLTEGGQFYLDSGAGKVYYKPLSGENLSSVEAYLGVLEALVVFGGTYANPVHDITFQDISFAHTTWLQPSTMGYVDQQTGGNICENKTYDSSNFESTRPNWCQMPSAIQISAAKNIVLTGSKFIQMGAGGVGIGNDANAHITGVGLGASNVAVKDSYFSQVMGNSITAGGIRADAHHPSDSRMTNFRIDISGNIFANVSSLFSANVPILATYLQYSTIQHNDIYVTPYSAICLGYGWGSNDAGGSSEYTNRGLYKFQPLYTTPTTAQNNRIDGNLIHGYGYSHTDLGAIYTLSKNPSTYITKNYAFDSSGFGLYNDEGSNSYTMQNNVLLSSGIWYAQNGVNTANNTITGNFGKTGRTISGNTLVSDVSQVSISAKKAAYRAGVLPGKRMSRPVSNPSNLPDGAVAVGSSGGKAVVTMYNFDDAVYSDVVVTITASGTSFSPVGSVPTTIPGSGTATATYTLSGSNRSVSVTVRYRNSRTGVSSSVSASGAV